MVRANESRPNFPRRKENTRAERTLVAGDSRSSLPASAHRQNRELWWLAALCLLSAGRIFFGAAALPFFADTDEYCHFDLTLKFARGYWPGRDAIALDPGTVDVWLPYGSIEFLRPDAPLPFLGQVPPFDPRTGPDTALLLAVRGSLLQRKNFEAHSPPVYYALAAGWYHFGRMLGFDGPHLVYWLRFLNVPLFAGLVTLSYVFCRPYFRPEIALTVASLVAFFPNTVFFTINSDVLSPLLVVAALIPLLRWSDREQSGAWLAMAAGAAAFAAVLVKLTNVAVLSAVAVALVLRFRRLRRAGRVLRESALLIVPIGLPLFLWALRNRLLLGDWTGTAPKIEHLRWTAKPFGELLDHPLFTLTGLVKFLQNLAISFYYGDLNWLGQAIRSTPASYFLLVTSAVLPPLGTVAYLRRNPPEPRGRIAAAVSALVVVAYVGVLAFLSLRFDFGTGVYPSRDFPFLASGRLAAGALVPLLTLYACGLDVLCFRKTPGIAVAAALTLAVMVFTQMLYLEQAVKSPFNWFHLS